MRGRCGTFLKRTISTSEVSEVFNSFMLWMPGKLSHLLTSWRMYEGRMSHYAPCFYAKGAVRGVPLWAVVDGTLEEACMPNEGFAVQRGCYSGHHEQHGLRYLAIATPDGLRA